MTKGEREKLLAEVAEVEIDGDVMESWRRQQRDALKTQLTQLVGKFGILDVAGKENELSECVKQVREAREMITYLNDKLKASDEASAARLKATLEEKPMPVLDKPE